MERRDAPYKTKRQKQRHKAGGTEVMTKLKWIGLAITGVLLALVIVLSVAVAKKNSSIHTYKYQVEQYEQTIDSLQKYNRQLGGMDGISVTVEFNLTQKNILSFSQSNCQNIAKEVAHLTRQELLDSLKVKEGR